jgi:tRNA threonylcarbamoyl adenosine modification protein YeaZ
LLALDTATANASVALYELQTQHLLVELTWEARRRQTQDLLPAVQDVLRLLDQQPAAISALAVTTGPGSFTGVRIAISAAKGMALGLPQPPRVVGIPTLSVTAAPFIELVGSLPAGSGEVRICAAIQAGRGRYNWAWYGRTDILHRPGVEEHHAGTVMEFSAHLVEYDGIVWLVGEIGADLAAALSSAPALRHIHVVDSVSSSRRGGQLARLAALHLAGECADTVESLQPLYLRNP